MVHVPDRAYIHVRLGPLKFALGHVAGSSSILSSLLAFHRSRVAAPPLTRSDA
jgi:hypothetical protein